MKLVTLIKATKRALSVQTATFPNSNVVARWKNILCKIQAYWFPMFGLISGGELVAAVTVIVAVMVVFVLNTSDVCFNHKQSI